MESTNVAEMASGGDELCVMVLEDQPGIADELTDTEPAGKLEDNVPSTEESIPTTEDLDNECTAGPAMEEPNNDVTIDEAAETDINGAYGDMVESTDDANMEDTLNVKDAVNFDEEIPTGMSWVATEVPCPVIPVVTAASQMETVTDSYDDSSTTSLAVRFQQLTAEMLDMKTAVALSEEEKVDQIELIEQKCQQQLLSMQQIVKDAVLEARSTALNAHEEEKARWHKEQQQLKHELQQLRVRLKHERDGFLSSVAKTLQKKVGAGGLLESENLEESMKKAQQDTAILKSVVMPLEEEIIVLKGKLKLAYSDIIRLQHKGGTVSAVDGKEVQRNSVQDANSVETPAETVDGSTTVDYKPDVTGGRASSPVRQTTPLDEKVRELNQSLETEKSSRTDLEMYVAVLNTQKSVLQEDSDKLRAELQDVCRLLECEKREHNDLKQTWLMANDQFLSSQQLIMAELLQLKAVLSPEQLQQLAEIKRKAELSMAEVEQTPLQRTQQEPQTTEDVKPEICIDLSPGHLTVSRTSLTSAHSDDLSTTTTTAFDKPSSLTRTQSSQSLQLASATAEVPDVSDSWSLQEEAGVLLVSSTARSQERKIPHLSEAMQKAITDPTPEVTASETLVANVKKSAPDVFSMVGRRLVSEKEWARLQTEVKRVSDSVGRPCELCEALTSRLDEARDHERKLSGQVCTLERQLQAERRALAGLQQQLDTVDATLCEHTADYQQQISALASKVTDAERYIQETKKQFLQSQTELHNLLKTLTQGREEIHKELTRLQEANENLMGKQLKHSQTMQDENINLPNTVEEMHLLLLRYREDLISAAVAKEYGEETMKSEAMFLKSQVVAEQQEKATLEETLTQEISTLQETLVVHQSVKSELDRQTILRSDAESKLRETESSLKSIQAKSKQLIHALQNQVEQHSTARTHLESKVDQLKMKLQSLQVDFDNSEAVQQDFVKLSQSLQIQLEKIRAAEHEVRWQHEEDIDDCSNCRHSFSVTKRKHHCKHCGRIFCADCVTKTVHSGPNLRPSRVCDVCHTILVQDATPYFSSNISNLAT